MNEPSYTCGRCHRTSYNPSDVANLYCGYCHLFANQLRDDVVTHFAHLTSQRLTKRDCFSLAALTMIEAKDSADARLVHGLLPDSFNVGQYVQHAWVEMPAKAEMEDGSEQDIIVVIDYTQPDDRASILPRDFFLERTKPLAMRHFTFSDLVRRATQGGGDGPWDDSPSESTPQVQKL